jgi:putative PIN family toxin of toxin-antitoxin system
VIRAVLDTNVLASGFVGLRRPGNTPGQLIRCWLAGLFVCVASEHIRAELATTLNRKYFRNRFPASRISAITALVKRRATTVPLTEHVQGVATHPEDDLILATALSGQTEYLVTGDSKLLKLGTYRHVRILSPATFLAVLQSEEENQAA